MRRACEFVRLAATRRSKRNVTVVDGRALRPPVDYQSTLGGGGLGGGGGGGAGGAGGHSLAIAFVGGAPQTKGCTLTVARAGQGGLGAAGGVSADDGNNGPNGPDGGGGIAEASRSL